ncbi:hypothetical protein [Labrys sp. KNU-23]|nr:hypothetical protein [Labrys sp. KNU-23]
MTDFVILDDQLQTPAIFRSGPLALPRFSSITSSTSSQMGRFFSEIASNG